VCKKSHRVKVTVGTNKELDELIEKIKDNHNKPGGLFM